MGGKRRAACGAVEEAETVCEEIRAALGAVGIVLPSLWVESAAYVTGEPLIELGRCNLSTARMLADVLTKARPSST